MKNSITIEELTHDGTNWAWTQEKIEVNEKDFLINEADLDGEAVRLGQLIVLYGAYYASARTTLVRHENEVKRVYAIEAGKLRSGVEIGSETRKFTEGRIKEEVEGSNVYQAAVHSSINARGDSLRADTWWKAINTKAELLKMLGYRDKSEMKNAYD